MLSSWLYTVAAMGERKVLNKYYPPDFDPAMMPRKKGGRKEQIKVRMMLPMSIRCNTCGNFIYKGTKFNSRKEDAVGEDYLGIQIYRFYFKCTRCSGEIAMKTDPKNSDYVLEAGASRNYEPWRDKDIAKDEAAAIREEEEAGNAMKALENRTKDSKREIDILNALDEVKALNAQHARLTPGQVLAAIHQKEDDDVEDYGAMEEDLDAVAKEAFERQTAALAGFVRRIDSDDSDEDGAGAAAAKKPKLDPLAEKPAQERAKAADRPAAFAWGGGSGIKAPVVVVRKREPVAAAAPAAGLAGLLGAYGSSSGSESGGGSP